MSVFDKIRVRKPKYSTFDLSYEKKLSFKMGQLIPTYLEEIVPGDNFKVRSEIMLRLAPMLAPIMHRVNVFTHYFFVPNRIIWDEWEQFITGGPDGTANPTVPRWTIDDSNKATAAKGTLYDYMGMPVIDPAVNVNPTTVGLLPFRAYQKIYNEYYRDQNLENEVDITNLTAALTLRTRAWEKDYFTSALPWAQRGAEVDLPLEINYNDQSTVVRTDNGQPVSGSPGDDFQGRAGGGLFQAIGGTDNQAVRIENIESLGLTINEFRTANRLQQWLERNARGGSRYIEQIFAHFGVKSSDARLQRPEYLAGGRQPITLSEVLNTTGITEGSSGIQGGNVQGAMAGHGISVGSTNQFRRRFEEHGWVFGITSVLPRTAYQQGMHRKFKRYDKFDYYFPEFAQLGEQDIRNEEVYLDYAGTNADRNATFGYTPRYSEYKYRTSEVAGDFRDNLNFWHMGRIFDNAPALNDSFVKADPTDRIFAVQDGTDTLWCQVYHNVKATRPMPYYGTPTL